MPLLSFLFPYYLTPSLKQKVLCPYQGYINHSWLFAIRKGCLGKRRQSSRTPPPCPSAPWFLHTVCFLLSLAEQWQLTGPSVYCVLGGRGSCLEGLERQHLPSFPSEEMGYNCIHVMEKQNVSGKPPFWTSGCIILISASTFMTPSRHLTALLSLT